MILGGKARRVCIYINEGDLVGHRAAHLAILEFLREQRTAGATVLRAIEGFTGTRIFSTRLVDVEWKLPLVIEWIDTVERVQRVMPLLLDLVKPIDHGLITVDDTEVVFHHGSIPGE